jgi:hypothetical protein
MNDNILTTEEMIEDIFQRLVTGVKYVVILTPKYDRITLQDAIKRRIQKSVKMAIEHKTNALVVGKDCRIEFAATYQEFSNKLREYTKNYPTKFRAANLVKRDIKNSAVYMSYKDILEDRIRDRIINSRIPTDNIFLTDWNGYQENRGSGLRFVLNWRVK